MGVESMAPLLASFDALANRKHLSTLPFEDAFTSVPDHGESTQKQEEKDQPGQEKAGQETCSRQNRKAGPRQSREESAAKATFASGAAARAHQTSIARPGSAAARQTRIYEPL